LFEAGTLEVEHLRGQLPLEKLFYLSLCKGVFKKVTVVYFNIILRKKLLRLAAGISLHPAIKIDFHGYFTSIFFVHYIGVL
jgi:hypothetical protein